MLKTDQPFVLSADMTPAGDQPEAIAGIVERLDRAFRSGGVEFVKSLVWRRPADTGRCWYWSAGWSLSYDPV